MKFSALSSNSAPPPKAEPMAFDLTNEEKAQQAFEARLKDIKAALNTAKTTGKNPVKGKGVVSANGGAISSVKENGNSVAKEKENAPAKHTFHVATDGTTYKLASGSPIPKIESSTKPEGNHILVSRAETDLVIQLLNDARDNLKDSYEESQKAVPDDSIMSGLEDLQTKCDAVLTAVQEIQEGVCETKAAYSQMADAQKQATTASCLSFAKMVSGFDSVLETVQNSLRMLNTQAPSENETSQKQNPIVDKASVTVQHSLNGGVKKESVTAEHAANGEVKKEIPASPLASPKKVELPVALPQEKKTEFPVAPLKKVELPVVALPEIKKAELNLDGK
jgi:hypothetical protein